ncbi:hypothetical protein BGZ94_009341 [Podila epigama]|nr:hypothetical protein BGZ94_009341 [Podila epigama]
MLKAWQKTFRIDQDARRELAHKLAAKGWRLCERDPASKICVGEKDVCFAQLAAQESTKGDGPVVVATGDSDYLAHENILQHQNPKSRTEYYQFAQQDVFAIVCQNEYSANIHGYGAKKNWAILGRMCRRKDIDSPKALLAAYVEEKTIEGQQQTIPGFAPPARIFLDLEETLLGTETFFFLRPRPELSTGDRHNVAIRRSHTHIEPKVLHKDFHLSPVQSSAAVSPYTSDDMHL